MKHKKGMSIHKQKASDLGQGYKGRGPEGGMASKKKIPVRLYRKIEESNEPVMGLGQFMIKVLLQYSSLLRMKHIS